MQISAREIGFAAGPNAQRARWYPMKTYSRYRRTQIAELRPYEPGEDLEGVSISSADKKAGSPKAGDMIARNPKKHADQWLVEAKFFAENFEPLSEDQTKAA